MLSTVDRRNRLDAAIADLAADSKFTPTLLLTLTGLMLMVPNPVAIASLLIAIAGIQVQVRGVEEPYLRGVHGDTYRDYTTRVGPSCPGSRPRRPRQGAGALRLHAGLECCRLAPMEHAPLPAALPNLTVERTGRPWPIGRVSRLRDAHRLRGPRGTGG